MGKFKNSILLAGTISYLIASAVMAGNLAKNFQDSVHKVANKSYIHDTSNVIVIRFADQKECQMLLQALKREPVNVIKNGKQHLNDSNTRKELNTNDIEKNNGQSEKVILTTNSRNKGNNIIGLNSKTKRQLSSLKLVKDNKLDEGIKNSSSRKISTNNQLKNSKQAIKLNTLTNNNKIALKFKTFVIKANSSLLFNINQISKEYGWKVVSPGTEDITILLTKKIKTTDYKSAIENLIKDYPISVKLYKKNKVIKVNFAS